MPQTQFNKFTYPAETDVNAFWDMFVGLIQEMDTSIWQIKNNVHAFMFGGGTKSWNSSTGLLQWTADFVVPIVTCGQVVQLRYGPDGVTRSANIQTGSFLAVQLPTVITETMTKNVYTGSQLEHTEGQFVLAYNYNGTLHVRDGSILT